MSSTPKPAADWTALQGLADRLIDAGTARARAAADDGDAEAALQWVQTVAGFIAHAGTFGRLASAALERIALEAAATLPAPALHAASTASPPRRVLHVLTEAFAILGHTKLCRRWIALDTGPARHDVVLLDAFGPTPPALADAVALRGGTLTRLDRRWPLLERSRALRAMAWAHADLVVLHVHPNDAIPLVAFGIDGGPPVLLMNHADHEFWLGGAVADRVVDSRDSGQQWTRRFRGIDRHALLPVPLEPGPARPSDADARLALRHRVRAELGIPADAFVFLTVGTPNKYRPVPGLSFLGAAEAVLARLPGSRLLAIGPRSEGDWAESARRTGGRLLPIGPRQGLDGYRAAADLYLESLPAGSLTALLEAGLAGLAVVRAPARSRPPHAADGEALDGFPQPADLGAYVDEALALAADPRRRAAAAARLQRQVLDIHCRPGWNDRLAAVMTSVQGPHRVHRNQPPQPLEPAEATIKLAHVYPQPHRARAQLVGSFLLHAVQNSAQARGAVAARLIQALRGRRGGQADAAMLLDAVLPELGADCLAGTDAGTDCAIDPAPIARWLIRRAAEEGRRAGALGLALRLTPRVPGLWRRADAGKGVKALIRRGR